MHVNVSHGGSIPDAAADIDANDGRATSAASNGRSALVAEADADEAAGDEAEAEDEEQSSSTNTSNAARGTWFKFSENENKHGMGEMVGTTRSMHQRDKFKMQTN